MALSKDDRARLIKSGKLARTEEGLVQSLIITEKQYASIKFLLGNHNITFSDIEKVTGLSRGAILYHFKSKDQILSSVIDKFIINKEYDLPTIDASKSMWDNIESFVDVKRRQQDFFTGIGILNINRAFIYSRDDSLLWTVLADFHPEIMGFQNCERKEPFF